MSETGPTQSRRNDAGALLQLALAGIVLILLGLAASQARRDPPEDEEASLPMMEDTAGYDFDAAPFDDGAPYDSIPFDDTPARPDTAIPEPPPFTPGAAP